MSYDLFGSYSLVDDSHSPRTYSSGRKRYDSLFGSYNLIDEPEQEKEPEPIDLDKFTLPDMQPPGGVLGAIPSGIAQGLYGIGTAWNKLTGDDEEARLYSQLSSNISEMREADDAGFMENVVRGVSRSLTMAVPTVGATIAGTLSAPALGVSAGVGGLIAGTATTLGINVPATFVDADLEAESMGLKDEERYAYARNSALIEGTVTSLFSAIPGFAGMEDVATAAVKGVGKTVAGAALKRIVGEFAEEELITIGQHINRKLYSLDPEQVTMAQLGEEIAMTGIQTVMTMGIMEGGSRGVRSYLDRGQPAPTTQPAEVIQPQPIPTLPQLTDAGESEQRKSYWRETSLEGLDEIIGGTTGGYTYGPPELHFSDERHLALGQKNNKGVMIQFDEDTPLKIKQKIGTELPFSGKEYTSNVMPSELLKHVLSVEINPNLKKTDKPFFIRMNGTLERLDWVKGKTDEGNILWTPPRLTTESTLATDELASKLYDTSDPSMLDEFIKSPSRKTYQALTGIDQTKVAEEQRLGDMDRKVLASKLQAKRDELSNLRPTEEEYDKSVREYMRKASITPEGDPLFEDIAAFRETNRMTAEPTEEMKRSGLDKVRGIEFPEIKSLLDELGGLPMIQKRMSPQHRGYFDPNPPVHVALNKLLGSDINEAVKTAAHEAGHAFDWVGEEINTARGNLTGHLLGMINHTAESVGENITMLNADQQRAVHEQAYRLAALDYMKANLPNSEAIDKRGTILQEGTYVKDIEESDAFQDFYNQRYAEARRTLYNLKEPIIEAEIRAEMERVAYTWNPHDPAQHSEKYNKYRASPDELVADVASVLFNSPGIIQKHAPKTWAAIMHGLDRKPKAKESFLKLQFLMNGDGEELAAYRTQQYMKQYELAEDAVMAVHDRKIREQGSFVERMKNQFAEIGHALYGAAYNKYGKNITRHLKYTGDAAESVEITLDDLHRPGVKMAEVAHKMDEYLIQPSLSAGASLSDLNEILMHRRIAGEDIPFDNPEKMGELKGTVFYPHAFTPETSKAQLEGIKKRLGEDKYAAVEKAIDELYNDVLHPIAKKVYDNGGMSQEAWDEIQRAGDAYTTFLSLYYYAASDGYVDPTIKARTGNLGPIVNPVEGTAMKMAVMAAWAQKLEAQKIVLNGYTAGETVVSEAEPKRKPKNQNHQWVRIRQNGETTYVSMPRALKNMFAPGGMTELEAAVAPVSQWMYSIFTPLYITGNPAWATAQLFMDSARTVINAPVVSKMERKRMMNKLIESGMSKKEAEESTKHMEVGVFKGDNKILAFENMKRAFIIAKNYAGRGKISAETWDLIDKRILALPHDLVTQQIGMTNTESDAFENSTELVLASLGGQRIVDKNRTGLIQAFKTDLKEKGAVSAAWNITKSAAEMYANLSYAFTKALGAIPMTKALGDNKRSAYLARKYIATPDLDQRGSATQLLSFGMMYFKPAINGFAADVDLLTSKETAANYVWQWTKMVGVAKLATYALAAGAFGEGMKEIWELIPEYFRKNYLVIPYPFTVTDADGEPKAAWIMMKPDPMSRMLGAITDTMFYTMLERGEKSFEAQLNDMVERLWSNSPFSSGSPVFTIPTTWLQYASGVNPIDPHFGGTIVRDDAWRSGGQYRVAPVINWTAKQFGWVSTITQPIVHPWLMPTSRQGGYDTIEGWTQGFPLVSRFVRVSNRGLTEKEQAILELEKDTDARIRMELDSDTKAISGERSKLQILMRSPKHKPTAKDREKLAVYNVWYNSIYRPLRREFEIAYGAGDDAKMKEIKDTLAVQSKIVKDGAGLPEIGLNNVAYRITAETPEDEDDANTQMILASKMLAKNLPREQMEAHLRAGYIERMATDRLEKETRRRGIKITNKGLPEEYRRDLQTALIQSAYRPKFTETTGRLTEYGKRVVRLRKMLGGQS